MQACSSIKLGCGDVQALRVVWVRRTGRPFLRRYSVRLSIRLRFRARLSKNKRRRDELCLVRPRRESWGAAAAGSARGQSCASTAPGRSRESSGSKRHLPAAKQVLPALRQQHSSEP
jgi:hypothetical protein